MLSPYRVNYSEPLQIRAGIPEHQRLQPAPKNQPAQTPSVTNGSSQGVGHLNNTEEKMPQQFFKLQRPLSGGGVLWSGARGACLERDQSPSVIAISRAVH